MEDIGRNASTRPDARGSRMSGKQEVHRSMREDIEVDDLPAEK
jgi:hypothetical protein